MIEITLYSQPDCSLCDEVKAELADLDGQFPYRLTEINIETDAALQAQYFDKIPVLHIGSQRLFAPISRDDLVTALIVAAAEAYPAAILYDGAAPQATAGRVQLAVDRAVYWLSRHWLAVVNTLIFLYVGLPFAAPALMAAGFSGPAAVIYTLYKPVCHQLAYRSWFLFGEQPFYLAPDFQRLTGIEPYTLSGRWEARQFLGNDALGYKVAFCQRDVAIYAAILLGGLLYAALRPRWKVRPLPWPAWFLIGIVPIGLDGFSQLFSQSPFGFLPLRESTPLLRTLTGALFGLANTWLAFPYFAEAMEETRATLARRFGVFKQPGA